MTQQSKHKYKTQIQTLIKVNDTHIQKHENEILKLVGKKNKLLKELELKLQEIREISQQKFEFKTSYFKTIKKFGAEQVNFFRNQLLVFDANIESENLKKNKIQKDIDSVEQNIQKHRIALKKYSFKNEKYDYLKVNYT
jgi:flagellar biosynthesis chaperone FliJ